MFHRPSVPTRRYLLTTLGAVFAATVAACSVRSDLPSEPAETAPVDGPRDEGKETSTGVGARTPLPEASVSRGLDAIKKASSRINADTRHAFVARDVIIDKDGTEHVRFDRTFRGLPVLGGDLVAHIGKDGALDTVSQTLDKKIDLDPAQVSLDPAGAVVIATSAVTDVNGASATTPTLVVYARDVEPVLAYDVVVAGERADGTPAEVHRVVDANDGHTLDTWDGVETAEPNGTGASFFSGSVPLWTAPVAAGGFELKDPQRGGTFTLDLANGKQVPRGATPIKDLDNLWGDGTLANAQTTAVDAQYGTAVTWDYFLNVHGRNGIGNDGKGASNRVHYGRKYNNAFWQDSCFCMTYGDGDGITFNPFDSLDVAGHEMSHGVTSRTAKLVYSGESGGLNEGTSDIFGTAVEIYANNPNDAPDYQVGEKLYKSGTKALRYMYRPSADGSSSDCWYTSVGTLDVHASSGVANHFYYLLSEGSAPASGPASPTCDAADTKIAKGTGVVTGIGHVVAEKIWYRALTTYMVSTTKYAGARTATLQAATDLYPADPTIAAAVAAAWTAVNVR